MANANAPVPAWLRRWFVVHFIVDVAFAVPLLAAPVRTLHLFGWTTIDPLATRLVGAALMAIGLQSWLGRNEEAGAFRAMLNLKIIWSSCAILGIASTMVAGAPRRVGLFLGVFVAFGALWAWYRMKLAGGRA